MPQRRTLTLTPDQLQELLHARDHDPRPALRERCAALLKVAAGQSPYAVRGCGPSSSSSRRDRSGLLEYVGLLGKGQVARMIQGP